MSAQVIHLWGGKYEKFMRIPTGKITDGHVCEIHILPVLREPSLTTPKRPPKPKRETP
jgi:hypothetical protein